MNILEVNLEEMELHSTLYEEGLACLLHTILFVRAPGPVKPEDAHCTRLAPLTYAKCGVDDVDATVSDAIATLKRSLLPCGPKLAKGIVTLSFFEKRESKAMFGFFSNVDKVYFERWRIPIVVNDSPLPRGMDEASELNRTRIYDTARAEIQQRMLTIFENVNQAIEHVPTSMYEFELEASGAAGERRENSLARLITSPTLINAL